MWWCERNETGTAWVLNQRTKEEEKKHNYKQIKQKGNQTADLGLFNRRVGQKWNLTYRLASKEAKGEKEENRTVFLAFSSSWKRTHTYTHTQKKLNRAEHRKVPGQSEKDSKLPQPIDSKTRSPCHSSLKTNWCRREQCFTRPPFQWGCSGTYNGKGRSYFKLENTRPSRKWAIQGYKYVWVLAQPAALTGKGILNLLPISCAQKNIPPRSYTFDGAAKVGTQGKW